MSLPAAWVDRIFAKLLLTYGRDFSARWEGQDIAAVKADWGHELSVFFTHHDSIAYALQHLPEKPPSVVEFKRIARNAPASSVPRVEHHTKADPERVAQALRRMRDPRLSNRPPKQWAHDLLADHARGVRRPVACIEMAKRAIGAQAVVEEGAWD